jgi:PEP-CTERM motif
VLLFSGDGSGPATLVSIDTIPSGMTNIYGTLPINVTAWDMQGANTFTVFGGLITSADYSANAFTLPKPEASSISFGAGTNFLQFTSPSTTVQETGNQSGFPGVTFTPVSVPIPEPSSLILAGMAGICGFAWRVAAKRRKARNHQNGA